jgi:hypothetical protein
MSTGNGKSSRSDSASVVREAQGNWLKQGDVGEKLYVSLFLGAERSRGCLQFLPDARIETPPDRWDSLGKRDSVGQLAGFFPLKDDKRTSDFISTDISHGVDFFGLLRHAVPSFAEYSQESC